MSKITEHFAFVRLNMLGEERAFCLNEHAMGWIDAPGAPLYERFIAMVEHKAATASQMENYIRTALNGAGMSFQNATTLAKRQITERPLNEAWALAVAIVSAALFGNADYQQAADAALAIKAGKNA